MKFCLRAIIALLTLLWFLVFTQASTDTTNNLTTPFTKTKPSEQGKKYRSCCLWDTSKTCKIRFRNPVITYEKLTFGDLKLNLIALIFSEYLNVQDILEFRRTCKSFQPILQPNKTKISFYHFTTTEKRHMEINVSWPVLKHFLNQSFGELTEHLKSVQPEIFNIKSEQYVALTNDEKIIFWDHKQTSPFSQSESTVDFFTNTYDSSASNMSSISPNRVFKKRMIYDNYDFKQTFLKSKHAEITKDGKIEFSNRELEYARPNESELQNIKIIVSNVDAFAVLLENGNVLAWGNPNEGGKIPQNTKNLLKNVTMLASTKSAFAALLADGSVITWGNGGAIPKKTQTKLKNVKLIFSNEYAFVALLDNGDVLAWGHETWGGKIPFKLNNVNMVFPNQFTFAALLNTGEVVSWGYYKPLTIIPDKSLLKNIKMVYTAGFAFAALSYDGQVCAWGDNFYGGTDNDTTDQLLQNVKHIFSNGQAFTALLNDDSVFSWGCPIWGGKIPDNIQPLLLNNVKMIFSTNFAFTALLKNGGTCTWGSENGGAQPIQLRIENVYNASRDAKMIFSNDAAFAALLTNDRVSAWGSVHHGAHIPWDIKEKLHNILTICPTKYGFTALRNDGEIISW